MESGNAEAFHLFAQFYDDGVMGIPQDHQKANELYLKAGELGSANAYCNLGVAYDQGIGVEVDMKRAKHYYGLAAMMGSVQARHNLGALEGLAGNHHRAMRHLMIYLE